MNLRKICITIIVGIVLASVLLGCNRANDRRYGPIESVSTNHMAPTLPIIDQGYVPDPGNDIITVYCWRNHKVYIFNAHQEATLQVFENHKDCEGK